MNTEFTLFPEQASTAAPGVDALFFFIIGVSVFFSTVTAVLLIYFALRYRRKSSDQAPTADRRLDPPGSRLGRLPAAAVPDHVLLGARSSTCR